MGADGRPPLIFSGADTRGADANHNADINDNADISAVNVISKHLSV